MKKYSALLRCALMILGGFLLGFAGISVIFSQCLKQSKVSAEAQSLVEELGTRPELDVLSQLAAMETESEAQEETADANIDENLAGQESEPAELPGQSGETAVPEESEIQEENNALQAQIEQWNEQLDSGTVANLSQEEQIEVHRLFANTVFFGDSMAQAIEEYGFMDSQNVVYQRSATIDVLIGRVPDVAAALPQQVVIFTGLNDCNHYTDIAEYKQDYIRLLQQLRAAVPGVRIIVTSLLPPSDAFGQTRPDLAQAPLFDAELRNICQENDVMYVDSTWIVRQENYLDDGIHMNRTFYRVWFRYLTALLTGN